jgi:hypothetical protein
VLHSHSHFAILGWLYNLLYLALVYSFIKDPSKQKKYDILFWVTQVSIIGMLFTFIWQGYAAYSISFSTMHIFCSYIFIFFLYRDISRNNDESLSAKFIYAGIFFLFLSSLGPWGLVAVVIKGLAGTDLYTQVIYFYLHFQYNGWFIFTFIGLWLKYYESRGAKFNLQISNLAFNFLFWSNIGAFSLSLLGFKLPAYITVIAVVSAFIQLIGARFLYRLLFTNEVKVFHPVKGIPMMLFRFSFLMLFVKFIMQLVSTLPEIGNAAYISRDVAIGFLHLVMLGIMSVGMLGLFAGNELIYSKSKVLAAGVFLFLLSFLFTEVILFYPALMIWFKVGGIPNSALYLFYLAVLLLISTILIFLSYLRKQVSRR